MHRLSAVYPLCNVCGSFSVYWLLTAYQSRTVRKVSIVMKAQAPQRTSCERLDRLLNFGARISFAPSGGEPDVHFRIWFPICARKCVQRMAQAVRTYLTRHICWKFFLRIEWIDVIIDLVTSFSCIIFCCERSRWCMAYAARSHLLCSIPCHYTFLVNSDLILQIQHHQINMKTFVWTVKITFSSSVRSNPICPT